MIYRAAKVSKPDGWLFQGGDGKTAHPCCAGHVDKPHRTCADALFCFYTYAMKSTASREQAALMEMNGQKVKVYSRCQFPGCEESTDKALYNELVPHGRHFCPPHLSPEHLKVLIPFVASDDPNNSYSVVI